MFRVLIGMVFHETNTFSPFKTGLVEFGKRSYITKDAIFSMYEHTKTPMGAFIEVLRKDPEIEIVPSVAAIAEPSGLVTEEAIKQIKADLLAPLQEGKIDAMLLGLHGAMATEIDDDGDGWILEQIREVVGSDMLIASTLDLHTNLSQRMIDYTNILVPYNKYPHSDMYERGLVAANLFVKALHDEIHPVMRWRPVPLMTTLKETGVEEYQVINQKIADLEEKPGILLASVLHSFYMTDSTETRAAAVAIADGDGDAAQAAADELAKELWNIREAMVYLETYTTKEALVDAKEKASYPVVFADICDNPGAGGTEDGTKLLHDLLELGAERVAYGMIVDPETVRQCHEAGVGATIPVRLGGKMAPEITGEPVICDAYVKALSDGKYRNHGPMHGGLAINLQKTAVIVIEGITIIVATMPTQIYDVEIFLSHGLNFEDYDIFVVKSSIHYRAAFKPYAKKMYSVKCPAMVIIDMDQLEYKKCFQTNYPFDKNATFTM